MVALEAKYHKSCLTSISIRNRAPSHRSQELNANVNDSDVVHGTVLAEMVSYIEDARKEIKPILCPFSS